MKYRPQRGGLKESMEEVFEFKSSTELAAHLKVPLERMKVKPYYYDERISWDTYIVLIDGMPVGFVDYNLEV